MLKREFKVNLKGFIIWLLILVVMFLFVFLLYPYILNDETISSMDELMKMFPEEMLKAFNMDMDSISTAYGWLKSEGFMYVLLIVGFYSSYLGGTILLKEENDKTIEYLSALPVTRNKIITNKVIVGITYIILMVVLLGLFNYVGLLLSGDFDQKQYLLLSITPIFIGLPLFGINLFLSTLLHKTKGIVGLSLGMVFISYLFSVISELSNNVENFKYISIHTLADVRNVITTNSINPVCVIVSIIITVLFIGLSYLRYNKKDLI